MPGAVRRVVCHHHFQRHLLSQCGTTHSHRPQQPIFRHLLPLFTHSYLHGCAISAMQCFTHFNPLSINYFSTRRTILAIESGVPGQTHEKPAFLFQFLRCLHNSLVVTSAGLIYIDNFPNLICFLFSVAVVSVMKRIC